MRASDGMNRYVHSHFLLRFLKYRLPAENLEAGHELMSVQGYSSLAVALVLPEGGRLVACDRDDRSLAVAREYYRRAGVLHKVCGLPQSG